MPISGLPKIFTDLAEKEVRPAVLPGANDRPVDKLAGLATDPTIGRNAVLQWLGVPYAAGLASNALDYLFTPQSASASPLAKPVATPGNVTGASTQMVKPPGGSKPSAEPSEPATPQKLPVAPVAPTSQADPMSGSRGVTGPESFTPPADTPPAEQPIERRTLASGDLEHRIGNNVLVEHLGVTGGKRRAGTFSMMSGGSGASPVTVDPNKRLDATGNVKSGGVSTFEYGGDEKRARDLEKRVEEAGVAGLEADVGLKQAQAGLYGAQSGYYTGGGPTQGRAAGYNRPNPMIQQAEYLTSLMPVSDDEVSSALIDMLGAQGAAAATKEQKDAARRDLQRLRALPIIQSMFARTDLPYVFGQAGASESTE